jgi:hypothetical protein
MRKMKKLLSSLIVLLAFQVSYAQTMRASIGIGSAPNRIRVYIQPDATQLAVISTLQFNVGLPNTVSPAPTLSLVSNNIAGITWIIDPAVNEGGYLNYNIYNAQAGYNLNCVANVEIFVMELQFSGGPPGLFTNTAHLVTLPDGGVNQTHIFYCTGTINSNGQDLYYDRDGPGPDVVVANGDSYRPTGSGQRGTFTSYARYTPGVTLPVTFASYDVKCNDKGALVTWSTSSELNSSKFEIQRSANGIDWKTIGTVSAAGNSNDIHNYQYVDISGGGTAQYRVRQVDIDGQFTYTAIKLTNCRSATLFDVVLYPVPANDKLNVVVKSDMDIATELRIVDMSGRVVKQIYSQINKGSTNIAIPVHNLANGQYMLVSADPAVNISSKFVIAH